MLYTSTVAEGTLDILRRLCQIEELKRFYLVGGTNLSLRYGHRISVDIDFFSTIDFVNDEIIEILVSNFPNFSYKNNQNPIGVFGYIDGVKIDIVRNHYFDLIDTPMEIEGIRMYGDKDIMAMKSAAVLKRGVKKDFWDIYELLHHYNLNDFIDAYKLKYPNNSIPISIPYALTYFVDADESEDPVSLKGQTWETVKLGIQKAVRDYLA